MSGSGSAEVQVNEPSRWRAREALPGTCLRGCCGMALDADGTLLVGNVASSAISRIDPDSGAVTPFMGPERAVQGADDITTDGRGTFWTTCATGLGGESVFRIDPDGRVRAVCAGLIGANGIRYDPRRGRLFVGQYGAGNGLFEIHPLGHGAPRLITRDFASTNAMDLDARGHLLVTVDGGRIARVDPDTGTWSVLDVRFPHNSALKVAASGEIYVSGYAQGRGIVWRVDAEGRQARVVCDEGLPPLDNLLLGPTGRLFVSSLREATVLEIDAQAGRVVRRHSAPGPASLGSMAATRAGLYVNDGLSLQRFDAEAGVLHMTRGSFFERSGFPAPGCLCADADGGLLMATGCQFPLADARSARVFHVDTETFAVRALNGGTYQGVELPSALCADGAAVYVAEFLKGQVTRLDTRGDDTARRVVAHGLQGPIGLACRGGTLYVAEALGQRIAAIDLASGRQDVLRATGLGRPGALALAPQGGLLLLDVAGGRLLQVDETHAGVREIAHGLPVQPLIVSNWPQVAMPNGLAVDASTGTVHVGGNADGSIWSLVRQPGRSET